MITVTLDCGHSRMLVDTIGEAMGVGHICYCPLHKTNSRIVAMNAPPRPPNPNPMLRTVLLMIQEAQQLNQTGKTWDMIYDEAKARLHMELDLVAKYSEPNNLWVEYMALYKDLDAIRAVLGMAPYPDKGLNADEVYTEVAALVGRCEALKTAIIPTPYDPYDPHRPYGVDYNGLVHLINSLVKS